MSLHPSLDLIAAAARNEVGPSSWLLAVLLIALAVWLISWLLAPGEAKASSVSEIPGAEEDSVEVAGRDSGGQSDAGPHAEPEPAAATDPEPNLPAGFRAASEEEAAKLFAEELSSGVVRQDAVYGIVYTTPPGEVDDLKEIKGVGKVLEGKLNSIGVYRFRQVAVWTDTACAEFSQMLSFKKRLYQDNWLAQARALHETKYGESL